MIPAHRGGGAVAKAGTPAAAVVGAMAAAAMEGAEATRTMSAVAGRASYVPDSQVQGTPDPGAMAVALVLQAVAPFREIRGIRRFIFLLADFFFGI